MDKNTSRMKVDIVSFLGCAIGGALGYSIGNVKGGIIGALSFFVLGEVICLTNFRRPNI